MTRPSSKLAARPAMSRLALAFRTQEVGGYILLRYRNFLLALFRFERFFFRHRIRDFSVLQFICLSHDF